MKDFTTTGKTAKDRYHAKPFRTHRFEEFLEFCEFHKYPLNSEQRRVANEIFTMPPGSGQSTLVALFFGYDFSAQIYEEEYFNFLNNGRSPQEERTCLRDIQSLVDMLREKCLRL